MKITDNRTITVEIDGVKHKMTLADIQRMYDDLANVAGVRRHGARVYGWPSYPRFTYGTETLRCAGESDTVLTFNTTVGSAAQARGGGMKTIELKEKQ